MIVTLPDTADLPAPGCSAIRRPARKKAWKTHASPPSEAFSNSRRDMPCPVPHASREKHHFRLGYEKSGLNECITEVLTIHMLDEADERPILHDTKIHGCLVGCPF